ncbi:hypothetical protein IU459_28290 [Nocardia amamiensis]|uniref:Uncharacterized protein n=1 Tax=Nocardia amamiensis TaxID=404578 RepID=A0ABS0D2N9_9NOCA|nr:hypothetical protein [Nocardia amamiensis]MBF6301409.1 hypothetical protein [Nocardia amamiensis]
MSDASVEVLLDDFENKDKWELAGDGAKRTHLTTFAEGAPSKTPGIYADGVAGADHRALVLLIRSATDNLEVDLVAKPGQLSSIAGRLAAVHLWVRSPHASIQVSARLGGTEQGERELVLGNVSANGEWQRLGYEPADPIADAELLALTIRLTEVVKREGEVMILLDDLTARTTE